MKQYIWGLLFILIIGGYIIHDKDFVQKVINKEEWCDKKRKSLEDEIRLLKEQGQNIKKGLYLLHKYKSIIISYHQYVNLQRESDAVANYETDVGMLKVLLEANEELIKEAKEKLQEIKVFCNK